MPRSSPYDRAKPLRRSACARRPSEHRRTPDKSEGPELPPLRLHIRAPEGALNESLRAAISDHRDELVEFVFELEETAAILQVMQGNRIEEAQKLAHVCVQGGTASPDGQLWLRETRSVRLIGWAWVAPLEALKW
jgi:hypothetical protein